MRTYLQYQAYTEKLSRKALLSAGVTGVEGVFFNDSVDERSFDRVIISSAKLSGLLRRDVLTEFEVASLCPDVLCCVGITCC